MKRALFVVLGVVVALGCVVAEVPRCVEDGHTYAIVSGERSYGSVTPPSVSSGVAGNRTLQIKNSSPVSVNAAEGWLYSVEQTGVSDFSFVVEAFEDDKLVCEAVISYTTISRVARDLSSTCGSPSTVTYAPGETYMGDLPFDKKVCPGSVNVVLHQPSIGAAVPFNNQQYVYSAPSMTEDASTTLAFDVYCADTNTLGCSGYVEIHLHEESEACQNSKVVFKVAKGSVTSGSLPIGNTCDGESYVVVRSSDSTGELKLPNTGTTLPLLPPMRREMAFTASECIAIVPISSSTSSSTAPETTTTTSLAPAKACDKKFSFKAATGEKLRGVINVDLGEHCEIVTYKAIRSQASNNSGFFVNIIGEFLYEAPVTEQIVTNQVEVSCLTTPSCITEVTIVSYYPQNDTSTSSTSAPEVAACANVYYYSTAAGVALSSSLNGMYGQDSCVYGRYFMLTRLPQAGSLELLPTGDFRYIPPNYEGTYDFKFSMTCLNKVACVGYAYIQVTSKPPVTSKAPTNDTSSVVSNPKITCKGSCSDKAWFTYHDRPLWDNSPEQTARRSDGHSVDSISVRWTSNALVFTVYSLIGILGARFPTFEPIRSRGYFESTDVLSTVNQGSPGFEPTCLDNQGRSGLGEDVWKWKTLNQTPRTGVLGLYYAVGSSWYQKFGGKHNQCDTFAQSCLFAPLLTPSNHSLVNWTIDIDDCDATWSGVIAYNQLDEIKNVSGDPIWQFIDHHQIKGTLLTEVVRAHSWTAPGSFDASYTSHDIIINLEQFVGSKRIDESLFSVDVEFFTYRTEDTNDMAFGINLLVHPFVTAEMESSYMKDRHVVGFKWSEQTWSAPSLEDCPTCTGKLTHCTSPSQLSSAAYKTEFPEGDCPAGTPRVQLKKGPRTTLEQCPFNAMHVYNQTGFSPSVGCQTSYQNITLRGVVPGSAGLTESQARRFHYEGTIALELLTEDGQKHSTNLDLTMYVSRLSQDLNSTEGGIHICRSGPYWPVLDPLGVSLPDQPLETSYSEAAPLCVDDLSSSYGPSDWALLTLNLPNRKPEEVVVNYMYVVYNDEKVYLYYRDESTGALTIPPASAGQWWQNTAPFLSFREVSYRSGNITTSNAMKNSTAVQDVRKAFMFIPGSMEMNGNVEVVVSATISQGETSGPTTFRRILHVDPLLTMLSRQGPAKKAETKNTQTKEDFYAIGVVAGVTVVLVITVIFFMFADNNRPLPKWIPRGKLIKETVFSVLPGGKKKRHKPKPVNHKDMYDAMRSGKY